MLAPAQERRPRLLPYLEIKTFCWEGATLRHGLRVGKPSLAAVILQHVRPTGLEGVQGTGGPQVSAAGGEEMPEADAG